MRADRRGSTLASAVCVVVALVAVGCTDQRVVVPATGVVAEWRSVPGDGDRRALVVTPEDPHGDPDSRPLFVVLHGLGQDAEKMASIGGWSQVAADQDAVVVFADGLDHSFDAGSCCGTSAERHVDDVAYLDSLIDVAVGDVGADPDAVRMIGFSNGAMMTYRYLCEGSHHLAGAASVAGTDVAGCTPSRPTPFIQIGGADDEIVPVFSGASAMPQLGPLEPSAQAVASIARAWSCPQPALSRSGPVSTSLWSPCASGVPVRLDVIAGLVHTYPMVEGYDGTQQILAFWGVPAPG